MAQYFFDAFAGEVLPDRIGRQHPHDDAALADAMLYARELATDRLRCRQFDPTDHVIVRDNRGESIARITFGQALDPEREAKTLFSMLCLIALFPLAVAIAATG